MYFEIFKNGKLTKRGKDIISGFSWSVELMDTPETSITLPIDYLDYISGREEIKIHVNDKIFWGIVTDIEVDKAEEVINVDLKHIVHEWEYRQISINNAVKDKNINVVFKGSETGSNGGQTISANPFTLFAKEVGKLSDAQIIQRAGASAWNTDGNKVNITSVDTSKLKKETGDYDVTFRTSSASVTVKASVKADPKEGEENTEESTKNVEPSIIDQIGDIYADTNFAYPGWRMDYQGGASSKVIDYVYSRQTKLEALTRTCELTDDLFWRVDFLGEKHIEVGPFGERKPYIISTKPSGATNIQLLQEPTIDYDFDNVINLATVYSEKSDSGMSSMTLREVYNDKSLQKDGFPVLILRSGVNNERDYSMYPVAYQPIRIAPNNELEFAVLDEESIAIETVVIEGTFAFNDLQPFSEDNKTVTDADRIKAARTAYHATIKKLKQARRSYKIELKTTEIPPTIKVGDKVRFLYDNSIYKLDACSNYWKKILTMDDWFYITKIDYDIDIGLGEVDTITLEKFIKVDRETDNQ